MEPTLWEQSCAGAISENPNLSGLTLLAQKLARVVGRI